MVAKKVDLACIEAEVDALDRVRPAGGEVTEIPDPPDPPRGGVIDDGTQRSYISVDIGEHSDAVSDLHAQAVSTRPGQAQRQQIVDARLTSALLLTQIGARDRNGDLCEVAFRT